MSVMKGIEIFNVDSEITASLHDLFHEDIVSFSEHYEDLPSDEEIEIYIFCCFLLFAKILSVDYLGKGIQRTEDWIAMTPTDHLDLSRRTRIRDTMLAQMTEHMLILDDITSNAG